MKINIPNPCTEKYNDMSPSELGRMCKVCNTEVVDFTSWETKDIVAYIQKSNQNVCGRLKSTQQKTNNYFTFNNWLSITASFILFTNFNTAKAVEKSYVDIGIQNEDTLNKKYKYIQDTVLLKFVDSANVPLSNVVVKIPNTGKYFLSDTSGIVHFPIENDKNYELMIDYIGYNSKIININSQNFNNITKITLEESDDTIGEVVVKAQFSLTKRIKFKIKRFFNIVNVRDNK